MNPAPNKTIDKYDAPSLLGDQARRRFHVMVTADGEPGLNYLCRGFKQYFAHAIPEVDRIVSELRKQPIQPRQRM